MRSSARNRADGLLATSRRHVGDQALHLYLEAIWEVLAETNRYFSAQEPWKLKSSDPERMGTVLYTTAEVVRQVALLLQPVMPESSGKILDLLVAGDDRAVVGEALLAVDDARVVDARLGVGDELRVRALPRDDGEGRRRDEVRVARGPGGLDVVVHRVGRPDRRGEVADVLAAHAEGGRRVVGAPLEVLVHGHAVSLGATPPARRSGRRAGARRPLRRRCAALGQRVSRCRVCRRSREQNFMSSMRSGLLRRFFLVM